MQCNHPPMSGRNFTPASSHLQKCYTYGTTEHCARDCKSCKEENTESVSPSGRQPNVRTRMVTSVPADCNDLLQYMFSSDSDGSLSAFFSCFFFQQPPFERVGTHYGDVCSTINCSFSWNTLNVKQSFLGFAAFVLHGQLPHTYNQKTLKVGWED